MTEPPPPPNTAEATDSNAGRGSAAVAYPGTPRWVKLGAIIAVVIVLLLVLVMLIGGGEHGPTRHIPSGSGTPPQGATAQVAWRQS